MSSPVDRIIIPVGGTDREFLAQEHAAQMAKALDAEIYGVHVLPDPAAANGDVFGFLQALGRRHGVKVTTRAIAGTDVGLEVVAEAGPLDLIVIGTRRLQGHFHLSSVTMTIIQHAEGPVQVVRLEV